MDRRLPTGIGVLDRKLDGGIPAGSVVAFTSPPASQGELLLYELTAARPTLYISTDRSEEAVRDGLRSTMARTGDPTVRFVTNEAPLQNAQKLVTMLPEEANLIVDPVDVLEEQGESNFRSFLNEVQTHMRNTGSIAVLHCLAGRNTPPARDTTEHMADVVFDLQTTIKGDTVENRLAVLKFRGGRALGDTIKLELGERVTIDTSRDIA
jgi:KaiC/GvpD/RAD55 family RecA-like ATPase